MGNQLKPFIKDKRYNKNSYALITQITTISKNKIFKDNIKCYCDEKSMKLINEEIINYLTK